MTEIARKMTNVLGTEVKEENIVKLPDDRYFCQSKKEVFAARAGESVVLAYIFADGTTAVKIV